jgi:hypothetical protein
VAKKHAARVLLQTCPMIEPTCDLRAHALGGVKKIPCPTALQTPEPSQTPPEMRLRATVISATPFEGEMESSMPVPRRDDTGDNTHTANHFAAKALAIC